jgi:hypothetical protein
MINTLRAVRVDRLDRILPWTWAYWNVYAALMSATSMSIDVQSPRIRRGKSFRLGSVRSRTPVALAPLGERRLMTLRSG